MSALTLGRFRIIRELARSNDIVYEATDPASGRRIALKELQIPANLTGQARQERIARFTREARAAARLQHQNIVRIIEHGQHQGRYYIAMEFLEGQSLRDVLRQRGSLPLQEALRIAASVADGLEFAHKNGVVHRDVKPDNVHLEPDGRVVITDFGIARLTFEPTLTADGQIFGTPSYMSPEQVTGKGIDKRSDLFSLGVMLYEMISGRKPFTGDSVITITYNIMNLDAPALTGVPAGVDQVVRRAMAKDPARRYATATDLAEDLRALAQGKSPRIAASMPPPPVVAARPAASSAPPRPAPLPASRPSPPPLFPPSTAARNGGPPPGARPLPQPAPWGAPNGHRPPAPTAPPPAWGGVNGALPYGAPGSPAGAAVLPSRVRKDEGSDWKWLVGWLGLAVVISLMILLIVWASVTAYDRFRKDSTVLATSQTQEAADQDFRSGRYQEALNGYMSALPNSSGAQKVLLEKNAARAEVELGKKELEAKHSGVAESFARKALQLNPTSAAAYVALGRALAQEGKIDEAAKALDEAVTAYTRVASSGASSEEVKEARDAADAAPLWKADALYRDGVDQMNQNPLLAQQRFQAVIGTAPNSEYARNSKVQLKILAARQGTAAPESGQPGTGLPADPGVSQPPSMPPNWDPSYRRALPTSPEGE